MYSSRDVRQPSEVALCPIFLQAYEAKKAADPEFYRSGDSMAYGRAVKDSDAAIDNMVKELEDRCETVPPLTVMIISQE